LKIGYWLFRKPHHRLTASHLLTSSARINILTDMLVSPAPVASSR